MRMFKLYKGINIDNPSNIKSELLKMEKKMSG